MPIIRCPKCGQAYDVPGVVAVRLPNAIATCHCGEWLAGSKAAVLARMLDPAKIKEVDLQPYRIDSETASARDAAPGDDTGAQEGPSKSIRIVALGADQALDTTFTIGRHPLVVGSGGTHVTLPEAGLSPRHCAILLRGEDLYLRDANSQSGTFLDGKKVDETIINDGVHLLQVGSSRLAIELTEEHGEVVVGLAPPFVLDAPQELRQPVAAPPPPAPAPPPPPPQVRAAEATRTFLVCLEGPLKGQEFEVPGSGLIIGREGHVRVPDEFLSRRHFAVTPDAEGKVRVKDMGSRNGTFLNSAPAQDNVVHPGDEIRAGVNVFRIEYRA